MDIYLAKIPNRKGREQSGFRPVVFISSPTKEISMIIPITSNILALRFPYTIKVDSV
jgi:mRNA-degrading endonuclease toxin of MazEF toxin-antitoxin module